ncbi:MAG TPA: DUF4365 domain-containing protein, partial [Flavobacterium sp.]|nr:DUF4365 domain-containing protein [Flavobacterium sp.]
MNEAERIFLDLDWIPRGITQSDVGIDMEVEVCEGGNPTGQLIAVQIKSGKSFFEGNDPFYLTYIGKLVHLDYWLKHCLPVIIILYNPDTKITLWNIVSEDTVKVTGKTWKIKIPRGNHLDKGALEQIKTLNKLPLYFQRLQRLAMQKTLMKKIKKGKRIIVEMEVYANKMSGRATLSIRKLDEDNNEKLLSSGTFIHLHGIQELQQMYPWADFGIDDDYYYEHEYDDYLNNYGQYDPEEGCYM